MGDGAPGVFKEPSDADLFFLTTLETRELAQKEKPASAGLNTEVSGPHH
jgi:hypothetical protein